MTPTATSRVRHYKTAVWLSALAQAELDGRRGGEVAHHAYVGQQREGARGVDGPPQRLAEGGQGQHAVRPARHMRPLL